MADPAENTPDTPAAPKPETATEASKTDAGAAESIKPAAAAKPTPAAKLAAAPKPAAASAKPAAAKAGAAKAAPGRRFFLFSMVGSWFAIAWTSFTLAMIGMTLGTVRFLFPNVLSEPPSSFRAGYINSYEEGIVSDQYKEQGAWVIRNRDDLGRDTIYALSTTCTHLGCTPNWLPTDKKFKCPCHGSGFKINGVNFEGPAPRPLERYRVLRTEDGQVLVDKSRIFKKEQGQWTDPDSFIVL
jgi:cytochrome b6-f complex iron-sulfur subunit